MKTLPKTKRGDFFQSYLIVGESEALRTKTKDILLQKGVSLEKTSPDIFIISPQKNRLTIDQVRELKSHIFQKPVSLKYKTIILEEAQKLTLQAQNSLLKLLEEPPKQALIILEADNKAQILPTILSRVITINLGSTKKTGQFSQNILDSETKDLLREIATIEEPQKWLDNQIISLQIRLKQNLISNKHLQTKIRTAIESCIEAKKMLEANVNPKFVLANLIFKVSQID